MIFKLALVLGYLFIFTHSLSFKNHDSKGYYLENGTFVKDH